MAATTATYNAAHINLKPVARHAVPAIVVQHRVALVEAHNITVTNDPLVVL